jgi:hypothetical protein
MNLFDNANGDYRFLSGIAPYSAGVIAMPGYEIVHATLQRPLPYQTSFQLIDRYLSGLGRPRTALCAVELRLPQPLSFEGFAEFNRGYQTLLADWDLLVDGRNPVARTNVAPTVAPPQEPALYAFSYTIPVAEPARSTTFIVAGAGELTDQADLTPAAVVRPGETSPDALHEKASTVMAVMQARLTGLGADWEDVTTVDIYTAQPLHTFLDDVVLHPIGLAAEHGIRWHLSHPPIADLIYEMDLRGVRTEIRIP